MSNTHKDLNLTTFPDDIDNRYVMIDPDKAEDIVMIMAFQSAMANRDFTLATNILVNNSRLQRMLFNAAKWNRHEDMIIAIQRTWASDIKTYLDKVIQNAREGIYGIYYPDGKTLAEKSIIWDAFQRIIDCGYFTDDDFPQDDGVTLHNINPLVHTNMVFDGNVSGVSVDTMDDLASHETDPYAHQNIIVDGNEI